MCMSNALETPSAVGNSIVSANVRAELGYADMNQGELAAALGISNMAMTRRLSDGYAAEFSASEIFRMSQIFGIDPGELFTVRLRATKKAPTANGGGQIVHPLGLEPRTHWIRDIRDAKPSRPRNRVDRSTGPKRRAA